MRGCIILSDKDLTMAADSNSAASQPENQPENQPGFINASGEDLILVLDFGSQTAQLIARRVREQKVFCQLVRHDLSVERIKELNPKGLILSGGPASVYSEGAPQPDPAIFDLGIPILRDLLWYAVGLPFAGKSNSAG